MKADTIMNEWTWLSTQKKLWKLNVDESWWQAGWNRLPLETY